MKDKNDHATLIEAVDAIKSKLKESRRKEMLSVYKEQLQTLKLASYRRLFKKFAPKAHDRIRSLADTTYPDSNFVREAFFNHALLYVLGYESPICCLNCKTHFLGAGTYCTARCSAKHAAWSNKARKARIRTSLKVYGTDNPAKNFKVRSKSKAKIAERTDKEQEAINTKRRVTTRKLYNGVDNVFQDESVKRKIISSTVKRFGSWKAFLHYKDVKTRKTHLRKTGKESNFQTEDFRKKLRKWSRKEYGTDHPMQNAEHYAKHVKSGFRKWWITLSDGSRILVQSRDEERLARGLCDKGYVVKAPPVSIRYKKFYNGETELRNSWYHPEFFVYNQSGNLLWVVEVKSPYYLAKDLDMNRRKYRAANRFCKKLGVSFYLCVYQSGTGFESIHFPNWTKFRHLLPKQKSKV